MDVRGENQMAIQQPTFKRQRYLLSFLDQLADEVGVTDLQKLVFWSMEMEEVSFYEFVPYLYGPYSFQLSEDIEFLARTGYLRLFRSGEKIHVGRQHQATGNSGHYVAAERGRALLRKTYLEYPYYALNSRILEDLFRDPELRKFKDTAERYQDDRPCLYTIGYEGRSIEAFINLLIKNNVRLLCDVRKNAISRKFGFSKRKLESIMQATGIRYRHFPQLGIESARRKTLSAERGYSQLFSDYKRELSQNFALVEDLLQEIKENKRVALMCFEKDPFMCHRHLVRDQVKERHGIQSADL
jgi:uncharacterized protein YwgA